MFLPESKDIIPSHALIPPHHAHAYRDRLNHTGKALLAILEQHAIKPTEQIVLDILSMQSRAYQHPDTRAWHISGKKRQWGKLHPHQWVQKYLHTASEKNIS